MNPDNTNKGVKSFLEKKNIEISLKNYLVDATGFMALGLFASLLIGTIFNTIGTKLDIKLFTDVISPIATQVTGPAIAVSIAYGLQAPPLVLFSSVLVGSYGYELGGPVGAYIATIFATEFGKVVSKETKVDILITPAVTILIGVFVAGLVGPVISAFMTSFGNLIMKSTTMQPILMGALVSALVGIALTLPISSAAICIMLSLGGLAGGAATVGCCCQMIGFAVMSYKENGVGGLIAQGIGTSMLQVPNIIKNWKIWIPPTVSSLILGPISTTVFKMENIPIGSGMGTCGFVGQFGTITAMESVGRSGSSMWFGIILLHFVLPAVITLIIAEFMRKKNWIKDGDLKLDL
ncbi:PTS sugar transporter subunit IIC [Clostridioides mangenotii]|uniref:PTS transporter subunit IIC n=1 Tax=Metaclostridioides mangenotii TaxID=1540 RepID=UPI002149DCEE|nr:PTS sugar transporter subunit IIC [Clostridioides mangenotii]MCR1955749.1 PTS sugar transporter subunit IIC [Clostridioides mangenotii]